MQIIMLLVNNVNKSNYTYLPDKDEFDASQSTLKDTKRITFHYRYRNKVKVF